MRSRLRSPIRWFGGKGNMTARLLPLVEAVPHRVYVEPFGGGASLLLAKSPSAVEVYNDLDSGLVGLFRVLRDPAKAERLRELAALTPYAREDWEDCRDTWDDETGDDVLRAYRFYVVARMSFSGRFGSSFSTVTTYSCRGMAYSTSSWINAVEALPAIAARLREVQIEHQDFRTILTRYDGPETLFYCDPPYVPETRGDGRYRVEMTADDHRELVDLLLAAQGRVLVSGYPSDAYKPLEAAGWRRIDWPTASYAVGRTRHTGVKGDGSAMARSPRVESLWIKPADLTAKAVAHA